MYQHTDACIHVYLSMIQAFSFDLYTQYSSQCVVNLRVHIIEYTHGYKHVSIRYGIYVIQFRSQQTVKTMKTL